MTEISWYQTPPKTMIEMEVTVKISRMLTLRYWIACRLFALAAWIINSKIVFRETLPILEAEQ
jgi:hypothetical protein